jgi:putative flippase GtrA
MHPLSRLAAFFKRQVILMKATSFALVGVVNTGIDASVFFLAYGLLNTSAAAAVSLSWAATTCGCADLHTVTLITANLLAWFVAVSFSYVLNSMTTFAAESGRKLTWQAYGTFLASGMVGAIANTTTLVLAAKVMPVWGAKLMAIGVSFLVNFSMSHFVVFRKKAKPAEPR